jgi:hypothetical protein
MPLASKKAGRDLIFTSRSALASPRYSESGVRKST